MADVYKWLIVIFFYSHQVHVSAENLGFFLLEDPPKIYKTTFGDSIGTLQFEHVAVTIDDSSRQIDYDPVEKKIYWTEKDTDMIRRCDLDGSNPEMFDTSAGGTGAPFGMVLDVVNRIIYYSSDETDGLAYVDMDFVGPATRIIASEISSIATTPRLIALDPLTGTLYYGFKNMNQELNSLQTDTTNRRTLVKDTSTFTEFYGMYVNGTAKELFFSEKGQNSIYFMDLSEDAPTPELIHNGGIKPAGLSVYKDEIYWCNEVGSGSAPDTILKIAKDGSATSTTEVSATYSDSGMPGKCRDIHFYIETPCVLKLMLTTDSSTEITAKWDEETPLCPADFYKVQYEAIDADQCDAEYTTTTLEWQTDESATLTNLKPYTTYRVTVTAGLQGDGDNVNAGPSRLVETQDTTEQVPSQPPPGLLHVIGETTTSFSWQEIPCGSRHGLVESYSYRLSLNDEVVNSGVSFTQDVILSNPSCGSVKFEVAGINGAGTGVYGNVAYGEISTGGVPSQPPPGLSYVIGETTTSFSWQEIPCDSRHGLIDSYSYRLSLNDEVVDSGVSFTRVVILGNPSCGSVKFEVAGINGVGTGVYGNVMYDVISTEPFDSNALQLNAITQTSVDVFWVKTECSPADEYTVEYTLVNLEQCLSTRIEADPITTEGSSVTLEGLEPGSDYKIIVSANTKDSIRRELTTQFTTLESVPMAAPVNTQTVYTNGRTAEFTWDEIPCGSRGGDSFEYFYQVLSNGVEIRSGKTSASRVTVRDLPCGIVLFQVMGVNDAGDGPTSDAVEIDVNLSDTVRTDIQIQVVAVTSTSADLSWEGAACPSSPFMITYKLTNLEQCRQENTAITVGSTTDSSVTLTGLSHGSSYDVTVTAPTLGIGNDLLLERSFVTEDGAPILGPNNVRLTSSDTTSLSFTWDEVPCGYRGGIITYGYELSAPSDAFSTVSGATSLTSVTINGLQEGMEYEFSVFAANDAGRSVQDSVSIMSPTDGDATTAIALGFGAVGLVIIGLAAFNGFIFFRNVIQPGNMQSFNNASGLQKLPGTTSPFEMQRQGLSAQLDYL